MELSKSEMDWVRCNKCFSSSNEPLLCTTCCHILCKNCLALPCPICKKSFKVSEIGPKMPNNAQFYFEDLTRQIPRLQKAIKFQCEHRTRFETGKMHIFEEVMKLTETKEKLIKNLYNLKDNLYRENEKIKKLQSYVANCKRNATLELNTSLRKQAALNSFNMRNASSSSNNRHSPIFSGSNQRKSLDSGPAELFEQQRASTPQRQPSVKAWESHLTERGRSISYQQKGPEQYRRQPYPDHNRFLGQRSTVTMQNTSEPPKTTFDTGNNKGRSRISDASTTSYTFYENLKRNKFR